MLMRIVLGFTAAYICFGGAFAVPFLVRGVTRIDPASHGSSWRFRLLIMPGVVALWPVLAVKWRRVASIPTQGREGVHG
jgi:hypothetical protein